MGRVLGRRIEPGREVETQLPANSVRPTPPRRARGRCSLGFGRQTRLCGCCIIGARLPTLAAACRKQCQHPGDDNGQTGQSAAGRLSSSQCRVSSRAQPHGDKRLPGSTSRLVHRDDVRMLQRDGNTDSRWNRSRHPPLAPAAISSNATMRPGFDAPRVCCHGRRARQSGTRRSYVRPQAGAPQTLMGGLSPFPRVCA